MNSRQRQRKSSLVLVFVFGAAAILFALALAFAGGGSVSQNADRSAPEPVHRRVGEALSSNETQKLYDELSPSMKDLIPADAFQPQPPNASVSVQTLQPPQIKTNAPWNGEWADALIEVNRGGIIEKYVVRYHFENGEWWLYATLQAQ